MPLLLGSVQSATPGVKGFDASSALDQAALDAAKAARYVFCLRYISFYKGEKPDDLSLDEATRILEAGLALMPIYPYAGDNWHPTAASGAAHGRNAADNASSVGFPKNVNLWLDLEGVDASCAAQDVIDHCNNWFDAVEAVGYVPGIYVGSNSGLSADQLFSALKFQHYWKSGSDVPDIPHRGYQLMQTIPPPPGISIGGVSIDLDVTQRDQLGGNAQWLVLAH